MLCKDFLKLLQDHPDAELVIEYEEQDYRRESYYSQSRGWFDEQANRVVFRQTDFPGVPRCVER